MVGEASGLTEPRVINLPSTAFFSNLSWSPNGERILLEDNHENLWTIDVKNGNSLKIETDDYPDPSRSFDAAWSPDSKWLTYSKNLKNRMRAIFIYSLAEKKAYQITDGLADCISPKFDAAASICIFWQARITDRKPAGSNLVLWIIRRTGQFI